MRSVRETPAAAQARRAQRARAGRGYLFMVLAATLCGLGAGFGAVALRGLIRFFQEGFFGAGGDLVGAGGDLVGAVAGIPWTWRLVIPAIGGLLVGPLVYFLAREARGHGVPEVMESLMIRGGVIRPRVVVVKALASAITIGSGGSAGREGPIVQIGSAIGSTIGQFLRLSTRQVRTLVGCGAAAGIAAAFNAPIAGALFAVEVLLGDFGVPQFSPIVIAAVTATIVSRLFLGDFPALAVPEHELVHPFELLPYAIVGVIAGLVALAFISVLYGSETLFRRLRIPEYLKACVGGLLVGAIGIWFPQVFGGGYSTILAALTGSLPVTLLGILILAKMLATAVTLSSGGSGGVFAPSLFLGAMTGGFIGTFLHQWFPTFTATSGAYALVTMGAVVAAATHAPITAIIIIFELTGDYRIIPPLMTACVISTLVATWLRQDSVYTLKLRLRGLDPFAEEDPNILKNLYVRDIIDREPEVIPASASFATVLDLVVQSRHTEFFVVDESKALLGAVSLSELRRVILHQEALRPIVVAGDLVDPTYPVVKEDDNLDVAMQLFSHSNVDEMAVVEPKNEKTLIGTVHQRDMMNARNQEVSRRDLAGTMPSTVSLVGKGHEVEIGEGYVVREILAPHSFLGHSLRELDIRVRFGVQVIFIRTQTGGADTRQLLVPTADDRVREGDTLIVAGRKSATDGLEAL